MDFELTEEQTMLRNMTRKFLEHEFLPVIKEKDRQSEFPFEIIKKMGTLGLVGGVVPAKYGGEGIDWVTHAVIGEELGRAAFSLCLIVSIAQIGLVEMSILNWGNEEQKQKYLPRLCRGEIIGCFATVEPNVGSNGAAIETKAVQDKNHWVLNGNKVWITNGYFADITIVTARAKDGLVAFIVERGTPGFLVNKIKGVMGNHISGIANLIFDNCCIPQENLLGKVGDGFKLAMSSIQHARFGIAAGSVGTAQSCIDYCVKYAKERYQFGKPIGSFQLIQEMIANMMVETEAARFLTYRAGYFRDKGLPYARETSMAKYYATEVALRAATNAIRLHGAYGYCDDFPVERSLRDIMGPIIFGGTNEIQKLIIGRDVLGINAFA